MLHQHKHTNVLGVRDDPIPSWPRVLELHYWCTRKQTRHYKRQQPNTGASNESGNVLLGKMRPRPHA